MGINVSKTVDFCASNNDVKELEICQKDEHDPNKAQEPQFNVNATKRMEREPFLLNSPTEQSIDSHDSVCSLQCPDLGNSPLPTIEKLPEVRTSDKLSPDVQHLCGNTRRATAHNANRPPWRPSTVSSTRNTSTELPKLRFLHANKLEILTDPNGQTRKTGYNDLRHIYPAISVSSVSYLYDSKLQMGQAHLRRCTAAQQVQARRPDIWDSVSVDCCLSPSARYSPARRCFINSKYQSGYASNAFRGSYQKLNGDHKDIFKARKSLTDQQSLRGFGDGLGDNDSSCMDVSTTDEAYPFHYVFYVEDKPHNLNILTDMNAVPQIAREFHCRLYIRQEVNRTTQRSRNALESVLYYQGKRVRPVTVAAQNMTDLQRFLDKLDEKHPEFKAGKFLKEQHEISPAFLVTDTKAR